MTVGKRTQNSTSFSSSVWDNWFKDEYESLASGTRGGSSTVEFETYFLMTTSYFRNSQYVKAYILITLCHQFCVIKINSFLVSLRLETPKDKSTTLHGGVTSGWKKYIALIIKQSSSITG
jgi:hypothetical protein